MYLTNKEIGDLPFRSYRKVASFRLRARRLTQEDVEQRAGVIHTLEGPVAFEPGDYLARGIQGEEYPINPEIFGALYVVDTLEPDTRGFASYRPIPLRHRAVQIAEPFTVERADGGLFTGKAGDYVVRTVGWEGARIVDRSIFEQTYEQTGNV
jgi:PGDYG protein